MFTVLVGLGLFLAAVMLGLSRALSAGSWGWSLAHFTGFLEAAVRRNMPLGTSVETYAEGLSRLLPGRRALLAMAGQLDNGSSLAEAVGRHPGMFPVTYRALVAAGERGGSLASVLGRLKQQSELDTSSGRRAACSALYPMWLLTVMLIGPLPFFMIFILPRFVYTYEEMEIPLGSLQSVLESMAPVLLATVAFLLLVVLVKPLRMATGLLLPALGRVTESLLWRTPLLGRFERRRAAAGYALAASRLLEGGIPQVEALSLAAVASGSRIFAAPAERAAVRCGEGQPLHEALIAEFPKGWLPSDFLWYVRTGERSGQLPGALDQAAETCFTRAQTLLSRLVGLIFPIGVALAGLNVGVMAYMTMSAITGMIMGFEL